MTMNSLKDKGGRMPKLTMKRMLSFIIIIIISNLGFVNGDASAERNEDSHTFKKKTSEPTKKDAKKTDGDENHINNGILTDEIPPIDGPKRTVSVGKFDAVGSFTAKYGNWDIGGGLAAMMTTALLESERFIVLERAQLQQILAEQELKGNKLTAQSTGPALGKLTGVQFFIYGAVTEFGTDDSGGGLSIGVSGGGIGSLLSGALSHQSSSGTVAMDIRLVDSTTGQVIQTHKVSEEIESSGFDLSLGYKGVNFGGNEFQKTPLGEAVRAAITTAVKKIALDADQSQWVGLVVDFDGEEVFVNAGSNSGVKEGDIFTIERVVKTLTDPSTGEILLVKKKTMGIVELDMVTQKISSGAFQPLEVEEPARGDFVVVMKR